MAITAACPACKKQFRFREELLGRTARCSGCQQAFPVKPLPAEQEAEPGEEQPKREPTEARVRKPGPEPAVPAAPVAAGVSERPAGRPVPAVKKPERRPVRTDDDEGEGTSMGRRLAWVGGGVLLLGGVLGAVYFLFFAESGEPAPRMTRPTTPTVVRREEPREEPPGPVSAMPVRDPNLAARLFAEHMRRTQEAAEREPALIEQIRQTDAGKAGKEHGNQTLAFFVTSPANKQMVLSPDGTMLAIASEDKTVKLCDLASCTVKYTLEGHDNQVTSVAFSPDGGTLASSSADGIRFWNPATGKQRSAVTEKEARNLRRLAYSPDGELLACASSGGEQGQQFSSLRMVAARTGEPVKRFDVRGDPLALLTFSRDGQVLATVGKKGPRLWEVATGNLIDKEIEKGLTVKAIALSPDGQTLALTGHGSQNPSSEFVRTYSVYSDGKQNVKEGLFAAGPVAFSPDGTLLAAFVDPPHGILLRDLKTGKQRMLDIKPVHGSFVGDVAFSPGGSLLILSGYGAVSVHVLADLGRR